MSLAKDEPLVSVPVEGDGSSLFIGIPHDSERTRPAVPSSMHCGVGVDGSQVLVAGLDRRALPQGINQTLFSAIEWAED